MTGRRKRTGAGGVRHYFRTDLTDPLVYKPPRIVRQGIVRQAPRSHPPANQRQANVLALLTDEPQTSLALSQALGLTPQQTTSALYGLALRELAHRLPNRRGWVRA